MADMVLGGFPVAGTTAQRPANAEPGVTYFNTTLNQLEVFTGTVWVSAGTLGTVTAGTGVTASYRPGQVVLTLTDASVTITDATVAGAHGSLTLCTFPQGHIKVHGTLMNLSFTKSGAGLTDTATYEIGIGSVAAATDNAALTSTEEDVVAGQTGDLTAGAVTLQVVNSTDATFNGTSTAFAPKLNIVFAADDASANASVTVNGTVTITYDNLGDV